MALRRDMKWLVGMVHVGALPGTPRAQASVDELVSAAIEDARAYASAGFDALLIENMHDVPYLAGDVGHEITATMAVVTRAICGECALPVGVQVLAGANEAALAVANAAGARFIRAENFAYAHVADEGLMPTAAAGALLRYRRTIGAERVAIWADVKKKHASHALTSDLSSREMAAGTAFCGANAIVMTGATTGAPADVDETAGVRDAIELPVCIGSGITAENLALYWHAADAFIVGSYCKRGGDWRAPVAAERAKAVVAAAVALRAG